MYLVGTPSKGHVYYRVFESEYIEGKEKKHVALYMGRLDGLTTHEVASHWRQVRSLGDARVLRDFTKGVAELGYDVQTLPIADRVCHHGDVAALWNLVGEMDLVRIIDDVACKGGGPSAGKVASVAAIAHVVHPTSKNRMGEWYVDTTLPQLTGIAPETFLDRGAPFYACMRALTDDVIREVERRTILRIADRYDVALDPLVYDVTSTYFHGKKCDISAPGYSRDRIRGKRQVNIGMTVTKEHGFCVRSDLFAGNTTDVTTFVDVGHGLHADHGSERVTMIVDRGMVSEDNILELEEDTSFDLICGLKKDEGVCKAILESCPPLESWPLLKEGGRVPLEAVLTEEGLDPDTLVFGGELADDDSSDAGDEVDEVRCHQVRTDLYGRKRNVVVIHRKGLAAVQRKIRGERILRAREGLSALSSTWDRSLPTHERAAEGSHDVIKGVSKYFSRHFEPIPDRPDFTITRNFEPGDVDGRRVRWVEPALEDLRRDLEASWASTPDGSAPEGMDAEEVREQLKWILWNVRDLYSYRVKKRKGGCRFGWDVKDDAILAASRRDGYYLLMASDLTLTPKEVYLLYHARNDVERGFHVLKSALRIRPVRHWLPSMVRAHVYLAILGYQLHTAFRYRLADAGIKMSVHDALLELSRLHAHVVESKISLLSLPTKEQLDLADLFGVRWSL